MSGVTGYTSPGHVPDADVVTDPTNPNYNLPHVTMENAQSDAIDQVAAAVPTAFADLDFEGSATDGQVPSWSDADGKWIPADPSGGGGGGTAGWASQYVWGTVFTGPAPKGATYLPGLSVPIATVGKRIYLTSTAIPVGKPWVAAVYVLGPSNNWTKPADPITTVTIDVGRRIGSSPTFTKALQPFDMLEFDIADAGDTPAANVVAYLLHDPAGNVPDPLPKPTSAHAEVAGQPPGDVLASWVEPTIPSGRTPTDQTITFSDGSEFTAPAGDTSKQCTGLPSTAPLSFTVRVNDLDGGNGLESDPSNSVTPGASASSERLTNAERQGQNWDSAETGTAVYQSGTTIDGTPSPLVGCLEMTATALTNVQAILHTEKTMAAGETGMTFSAVAKNDGSGHDVQVQLWLVSLKATDDSYDASLGFTPFMIPDDGASHTISITGVNATGLSGHGKPTIQLVPTAIGDKVRCSGMHWSAP